MKFAAVVVTYNRLKLLKEVLESFDTQTKIPDYVIVVNNASTDGTDKYLEKWQQRKIGNQKIVVTSDKNLGGSGGFYIGTKRALETDADWIWVSDDDAILYNDVFAKLLAHLQERNDLESISAVCGKILVDGEIALTNRNTRKKSFFRYKLIDVPLEEYNKDSFEIDCFSYVGVLLNRLKLEKVGLIDPDYFIWLDDVEHSWRLRKEGIIVCYPDVAVNHMVNKSDYSLCSWKAYYGLRNDLLTLRKHASFRYFFFKCLRIAFKGISSGNKVYMKICFDAINDSIHSKKGKSDVYVPGWKP